MSIIENLLTARRLIEAAPVETINLKKYGERSPRCGTLYCSLGWLAESGRFPSLRISWHSSSIWPQTHFALIRNDNGVTIDDSELDALFGRTAFMRLFTARGVGTFDQEIMNGEDISDRELALRRITCQILTLRREDIMKEAA